MSTVLSNAKTRIFICAPGYCTRRIDGVSTVPSDAKTRVFICTLCYAKVSSVFYVMVLRGQMGVNSPF